MKTFIEWISYYNEESIKQRKFIFELKNWTFEHYSDKPYSFVLKCKLCKRWHNECHCFELLTPKAE